MEVLGSRVIWISKLVVGWDDSHLYLPWVKNEEVKEQEFEKENRKVYPGLLASKVEPLPVRSFLQVLPTLNNTEFSNIGRSFPLAFLKYLGQGTKIISKLSLVG